MLMPMTVVCGDDDRKNLNTPRRGSSPHVIYLKVYSKPLLLLLLLAPLTGSRAMSFDSSSCNYDVVAIKGALIQFIRRHRLGSPSAASSQQGTYTTGETETQ